MQLGPGCVCAHSSDGHAPSRSRFICHRRHMSLQTSVVRDCRFCFRASCCSFHVGQDRAACPTWKHPARGSPLDAVAKYTLGANIVMSVDRIPQQASMEQRDHVGRLHDKDMAELLDPGAWRQAHDKGRLSLCAAVRRAPLSPQTALSLDPTRRDQSRTALDWECSGLTSVRPGVIVEEPPSRRERAGGASP